VGNHGLVEYLKKQDFITFYCYFYCYFYYFALWDGFGLGLGTVALALSVLALLTSLV